MTDITDFLKSLISAPGLSGYEGPVRQLIAQTWEPLTDMLETSRLGSLHGLRRGMAPLADGQHRPSILFAAHMDAIGLMVIENVDGLLRIGEIGGVDPRILPGLLVTVHGRKDLPAVVVQPPEHLLPDEQRHNAVPLESLWVDTGLYAEEVASIVRIGDLVSFAQEPIDLDGELLAGHTLDNRASVAAVTVCLEELKGRTLYWDVWAVATVQEEETFGGAYTSTYQLRSDLVIAIDVTFASSPGSTGHKTHPLGKGVTLGWGPNIHPGLYKAFKELAERLEIPYRMEVSPLMTGTDAYAMQITAEGIPSMVVSIPLRYMHTAVEMVSLKDIRRAGRLLAEFAAQLDDQFMEKLKWDPS